MKAFLKNLFLSFIFILKVFPTLAMEQDDPLARSPHSCISPSTIYLEEDTLEKKLRDRLKGKNLDCLVDADADIIALAMKTRAELTLQGERFTRRIGEAVKRELEGPDNTKLRILSINMPVEMDEAYFLIEALKKNKTLCALGFCNSGMNDVGMSSLLGVLREENKTLQWLVFIEEGLKVRLPDEMVDKMLKILLSNTELTISLSGFEVSPSALQKMTPYLDDGRILSEFSKHETKWTLVIDEEL